MPSVDDLLGPAPAKGGNSALPSVDDVLGGATVQHKPESLAPEPSGEIPGVPRLSGVIGGISDTIEGAANAMLPLGPDPQTGKMSWHIPEAIAAPVRGLNDLFKRSAGIDEAGQDPLRPLSTDALAAVGMLAGTPMAGGDLLGAAPMTAAQRAAGAAAHGKATLENQARGAISGAFERGVKGGAPSASDVIEEMNKARAQGQPLTLADVNNTELGALTGTTYRQGGPARAAIKSFMTDRQAGATSRVQGLINRHLSDQSLRETSEKLIADRSAHAGPLWDQAANVGPIWSDRLGELLAHPDVQAGIKRGYKIEERNAVGKNLPFNPSEYAVTSFNEAGDPVFGKVPTMKLMMVAKEGLDAIIDSPAMKNQLTGRPTKAGLSYMNLRDGLVSELDRLNPAYKQARDQWSGETSSIRALDDGKHFMDKGRFSLEELPAHYAKLSDSEKQFFVLGVADALKEKLFGGADSANKGAIINNEATRMRLRPLFGSDEEAGLFIDSIERERRMAQTPGRISGGSPTAERLEDDKKAEALVHAAHGIGHLLHGNFLSSIAAAMRVRRLFGGKASPELNEAVAKLVTDPNVKLNESGPLLAPVDVPPKPSVVARPSQQQVLSAAGPGAVAGLPQNVTDPYAAQLGAQP